MRIPNADQAEVDLRKLQDYSLNMEHRTGKNKARVFVSALGLTIDDAETLRDILLTIVQEYDAKLGLPEIPYPRLTSCYVL